MEARDLKELITFYTVSGPFSDANEGIVGEAFATVYASIVPTGGTRRGDTLELQETLQAYEITVRHLEDFDAYMQIGWGERILTITAPPVSSSDRRWTVIQAQEIVRHSFD